MMVSKKQLVANKRNAQKGGVKTAEGKAVTRLNALKHGLLTDEILLTGENEEALARLEERLGDELQPQGELERILVDRIVSSVWRLKRALSVETANIVYEHRERIQGSYPFNEVQRRLMALRDMVTNNSTEMILRYETTIERQIYKALHELIRLQMARQGQKPPAPVAVDMDVSLAD
jgi:hypothetical protein